MLHASGLDIPRSILAHGWWTTSGAKMSKSTGETVNPLSLVDQYGADSFRYFVMREMTVGQDAEFSLERFQSRYRADLGNDLGNLLSRLLHMTQTYMSGLVPAAGLSEAYEQELLDHWDNSRTSMLDHFRAYRFNLGLGEIFSFVRAINKYADNRLPWKLAKSEAPEDLKALQTCLATMLEGLRLVSVAISPVMPGIHAQIHDRLSLEPVTLWRDELDWGDRLVGINVKEKIILFPRD
jgi:methionyl-tRNA synthetase